MNDFLLILLSIMRTHHHRDEHQSPRQRLYRLHIASGRAWQLCLRYTESKILQLSLAKHDDQAAARSRMQSCN